MKTKFTKFVDKDGNYFYTLILSTGEIFENVPKILGDYLHQLEQKKV